MSKPGVPRVVRVGIVNASQFELGGL